MDWAAHRYHMGLAYQIKGDFIRAISEFYEALRLRVQIVGPQIGSVYFHSRVGDVHFGLGECYLALGRKNEAKSWFEKALSNYTALSNPQRITAVQKILSEYFQLNVSHSRSTVFHVNEGDENYIEHEGADNSMSCASRAPSV